MQWILRKSFNLFRQKTAKEDILAEDAESYDVGAQLRESDTPENLILSEELKKVVFDTIENLPDELKTAIRLRELKG